MKRIVIIAIIALFALSACATATLPTGATPAEKRAALCKDVMTGVQILWKSHFVPNHTDTEALWWQSYDDGLRVAYKAYCKF